MVAINRLLRIALWVPIAASLLTGAACAATPEQQVSESTTDMVDFIDLDSFARPDSPNTSLVGPANSTPPPDTEAPELNVPVSRLVEAWSEIVDLQPRSRILGISDDQLQIEAEQRSALFGFVDRISFRAIALGPERSTFQVYSRSLTGYSDFGVNRRRLSGWISALQKNLQENLQENGS